MNEYIIYSMEGETIAPNYDIEVDNCQVLGRIKASDAKQAEELFLKEYPWIEEAGFDMARTTKIQILTEQKRKDVLQVVDYLWNDEKRHFLEENADKNHIFRVLCRLKSMCQ